MSPDGRFVAFGLNNAKAKVVRVADEKPVMELTGRYVRDEAEVPMVAFSPDGTRLAVAFRREEKTSIWAFPPETAAQEK